MCVRSFTEMQSGLLPMVATVGPLTRRESADFWVIVELFLVNLDHFGEQ